MINAFSEWDYRLIARPPEAGRPLKAEDLFFVSPYPYYLSFQARWTVLRSRYFCATFPKKPTPHDI
jgi:hypothetical protein